MFAPKNRKRYCVFGCADLGGFMHIFPHPEKQPDLFEKWMSLVGDRLKGMEKWKIYKNRRVCSYHFTTDQKVASHRLLRGAVPSVNLNGAFFTPSILVQLEHNYCFSTVDEGTSEQDYVSSEHAYTRQKHEDHNYTKTPFSAANKYPAENRLSGDDNKIDKPKKNQSCLEKDRPTDTGYGFKSSIDLRPNNTRDEPNSIEDGIDLNSLYGFDEPPTQAIFSWQKEDILYPAEDTDVLMCPEPAKGDKLRQLLEEVSLYDDQPTQPSITHEKTQKRADAEYQCNICEKEIIGFHYTCVQCADFDLCGACEANGAHNTHYVLRVPKDRPYNEIQTVLAAIRQQLLAENLFLTEQIIEDSVKSEPEDEPEIRAEGAEQVPAQPPSPPPPAECDPLWRATPDPDPDPDSARPAPPLTIRDDDEYSDGSVYRPPRRKRRRRRSSNTNSDSDTDSSDTSHTETPRHHKARTKPATRSALSHPVHGNQIVTNPKDCQPDVLEVTGVVYELPDNIFSVPGTVFEVPGNIYEVPAAMAADGVLEVPDNITVFRQEPSRVISERIFVEEDVVQDNLEEDSGIVHLRVPPDTDDAALAQALHSQAYVVMKPLVIKTTKR